LEEAPVSHPTKTAVPVRSTDPSSLHGRFLPGAQLGERYRIVAMLGRGGMGEVYRADDLELGQSVALKFLPEKLAADPTALSRLRSEVRTARQIAHPNVCRVYDIGQADGHVFLSMEYVDGDDLSHVLRRLGAPSKEKAVEIARQLCAGLAAAHENGVLHRDLKPANVMLDGRGKVRITDFGLAGLAEELEAKPERAGTPAYMAPEQLEAGTVSVRSDVYSLGLLLYELFTGKKAFEGESLGDVRRSRSSGSVPSLQSQNQTVDPAIERVIQRCLEHDPGDRPPSVYSVLAALPGGDPLAAALAEGATPSPDMVASARERGGLDRRWALLLFAAVVVSLVVGAALFPRWTLAPERGPDDLASRARDIVRGFGHELPPAQAEGYLRSPRHPEASPPYLFWYRASPVSLKSNAIHWPVTGLANPLATPAGSVTVVLGSDGRLVQLEVVPGPVLPGSEASPVDWSSVIELAGLEAAASEPVEPVADMPAFCDETIAFRAGDAVFQAGAHRGRVVYAKTVWEPDDPGPLETARESYRLGSDEGLLFNWFFAIATVVSALIAFRNVHLGRGDRRGAIVYGVVAFAGYLLWSAAHAHPAESGIGAFLGWMFFGEAAGHAALHLVLATLMYVAVEPYVRRIWPRALIGWARLARGNWRDPAVGRETLLGIGVGLLGGVLLVLGANLAQALTGLPVTSLYDRPELLGDTAAWAAEIPHSVALTNYFTMLSYVMLLVVRMLTRRDWITIIAVSAILSLVAIFLNKGPWPSGFEIASRSIIVTVFITLSVMLAVRIGLVAAMVFRFCGFLLPLTPLTLDLTAFYAPQAMLGMLLFMAIAAYGLRTALAGQPLFRDSIGEDKGS